VLRVYRYYVSGSGLFPFKQLFRDQAWPASEHDADLIELACPTQAPRQIICLASYAHPKPELWAREKWPVQRIEA
jgi:hypothetical protein